jgi:hypothetical protein
MGSDVLSMLVWPCCFGPAMAQYLMIGPCGKGSLGNKKRVRERRGAGVPVLPLRAALPVT